ncbi:MULTISPECIES: hypothetical protein [Streptomyces]|uniref:hypothetical protein n=1 Tax=Streptomyces TaxID=1883 RepID=UPI00224441ED|nr:hypothetical protein [Streptomyces griseolus]MCW8219819.1 hypothetical protein [Streptomyces griseolus]
MSAHDRWQFEPPVGAGAGRDALRRYLAGNGADLPVPTNIPITPRRCDADIGSE